MEKKKREEVERKIDQCPQDVYRSFFFYHLIDRQIDIDKALVDIRIRLELL
jgi:hypothetical protein